MTFNKFFEVHFNFQLFKIEINWHSMFFNYFSQGYEYFIFANFALLIY